MPSRTAQAGILVALRTTMGAPARPLRKKPTLEAWMIEHWKSLPFGSHLELVGSQIPANGFIDILASDRASGSLVVFELKRGTAGAEVVAEQLARYVTTLRAESLNTNNEVWGAVVARDFAPAAYQSIQDCGYPVKLFTFEDTNREIVLREVAGSWSPE